MAKDEYRIQYFSTEKKDTPRTTKKCCVVVGALLLVAIVIFVIGIILLLKDTSCSTEKKKVAPKSKFTSIKDLDEFCTPTEEAKRIKLQEFLVKCQKLYFRLYPYEEMVANIDKSQEELNGFARKFTPFVPTPEFLKEFADKTKEILNEVENMKPDESKLKPKENQILAEIKVFLQQFMASIYDIDFYAGDWMFGPNYFCLNRICSLAHDINVLTFYFRPKTFEDIEFLMKTFYGYRRTFEQYTKNLKMGVRSGFVKSQSSCKAGADAFKDMYLKLILYGKSVGTRESYFSNNINSGAFYKFLPTAEKNKWYSAYNESVHVSLNKALRDGFSGPLIDLHQYLTDEHYNHCPPDNIASGVSSLPLDYVYVNGAPDKNRNTTKMLPLTNRTLDGKEMYRKFVARFTTTGLSPEEIFEEGKKQLDIFYPLIVNLSREYTKESQKDKAVEKMKKIIDQDDQWHAANFPEIESNDTAHARCVDDESAKKYCPVRWKGIKKWANYLYMVLGMIHPKLYDLFYFTGDYASVPNCPIKMQPHYNPSNGAMYFQPSDSMCTGPTYYGLPFFLEKYGPRFQEWSVNGHEGRPGHHFQYQGTTEIFSNPCTQGLDSFFHSRGYFVGFIEGWALYAENPVLSHDADLYKDNKLQRLGMLKWQIWRAVRLVVDTGLHYRGMNRTWALKEFEKYAWDKTDFGRKEITRYMSCPGQATGYMIGRLAILKARRKAEKELGYAFSLKDFHYQVLSLGHVPLDYLTKHIDRYISCVKDPTQMFCEYMLTPVKSIPRGKYAKNLQNRMVPQNPHNMHKLKYV